MLRLFNRDMLKLISHHNTRLLFSTATANSTGRLEGKIALITGGASGLGKATAEEFIKQGAHVFIGDMNDEEGKNVVEELGPKAEYVHCDVGTESDVAGAIDTVIAHHRKLDIMYNNAGIIGPYNPSSITDLDLDQFDKVMRVHVRGTMAGIKHATKVMKPMGYGSILCTASVCGLMGGFGPHSYSISKTAIMGIVRSLASELCRYGIRINCISPSMVATSLVKNYLHSVYSKATPEQIIQINHGIGELKGAKCEEIDMAKAALYLASHDSKYVSGHNLVVDGGLTCIKTLTLPSPHQFV